MTQKSRVGKENHRAAKVEEQHSESKLLTRGPHTPGLGVGVDGVETMCNGLGKGLMSPQLRTGTPDKNMGLYRPSASSLRSLMVPVAHNRNKRAHNVTTLPVDHRRLSKADVGDVSQGRAGDASAIGPGSISAGPSAPSSFQKPRKTRLERSISKSQNSKSKSRNRRDRNHRRLLAGDQQ